MKTQDECDGILTRFYGFSDGVIRWVRLRYLADGTRDVEIEVACRDSETIENEGWVSVQVLVRDVQEFTVRENPKTTLQVLSEGIHVRMVNDNIGVEFGGAIQSPQSLGDFRASDAFVIGTEIEFDVGPY